MKNTLLLVLMLVPFFGFAQLTFTPTGFQAEDGRSFIVIESEGDDQKELYQKSLTYLQGIFNSPNHALSSVDGQSITVNGFQPNAIRNRYKKLRFVYDLTYSATFEFKDGKVKFQVNNWQAGPLINVGNYKAFQEFYGVYSDDLQLQNQAAKDDLELFFNTFVSMYKNNVLSKEDW